MKALAFCLTGCMLLNRSLDTSYQDSRTASYGREAQVIQNRLTKAEILGATPVVVSNFPVSRPILEQTKTGVGTRQLQETAMSAALQTFTFEGHALRVVIQDDQPWWIASEIGMVLGLKGHGGQVVQLLEEDEKGVRTVDTHQGTQQVMTVSESGLYALIFKSRKPEAKRFRKWVTSEVLPAIRKTGHYEATAEPSAASLQTQIAELRSMLEDRAVKIGPSKETLSALTAAEMALVAARDLIEEAMAPLHRTLIRLGAKSLAHPTRLPKGLACSETPQC